MLTYLRCCQYSAERAAHANNTPASKATTGSPKAFTTASQPGAFPPVFRNDFNAIRMIGTKTGRQAFNNEGLTPPSANSSIKSTKTSVDLLPAYWAHKFP